MQIDCWDADIFIEVAAHSITNICFKSGEVVGLGENRLTEGTRGVASLGSFFHEENEFVHRVILLRYTARFMSILAVDRRAWRALFAAQLGWMLDAMDFLLFSFAVIPIREEFGLTNGTMGALTSV